MNTAHWFILIGVILIAMIVSAPVLKRLSLTTAIVYLVIGISIGPMFGAYFHFNPLKQSVLLEIITEVAVLISLYSTGLKLQAGLANPIWRVPIRLATVSLVLTVIFVSFLGVNLLGLSLGASILLGAIIAPTDPVLATEVQVNHHNDRDRFRFSLTGEAGINDSTAFPFVMLGLGLIGYHDLGDGLSHWILYDLIWASICGVGIGSLSGMSAAIVVNSLQKRNMTSEFMHDFLGLGLISISYGLTQFLNGYGFLAVFFAAYMLRQTEYLLARSSRPQAENQADINSSKPLINEIDDYVSQSTLIFNKQLERLVEVVLIILIGGMLFWDSWQLQYMIFAMALFFIIRPASVYLGLLGTGIHVVPLQLSAWFGIRGIGSMYYLMYAIQYGLPVKLAVELISVVLVTVTMSIILHGISVTPLMNWYSRQGLLWEKAA